MCEFCSSNNCTPLNDTVKYSGMEIAIDRFGNLRARYFEDPDDDSKTFESQDIVVVKFCPMCGRPFKGRR